MVRTLAQLKDALPGNRSWAELIDNLIQPGSSSGGTGVKHYNLAYLNWSEAGHTFDTDLDVGAYALKGANGYISSLTTNTIVYAAASGQLKSVTLGSSLTFASPPTLNTIQDIRTTATPTFAGLTVDTLAGVIKGTAGLFSGNATSTNLLDGQTIPAANLEIRLDRNFLDGNYYYETTYTGSLLTKETWYTDSGKGTKLREITYAYS